MNKKLHFKIRVIKVLRPILLAIIFLAVNFVAIAGNDVMTQFPNNTVTLKLRNATIKEILYEMQKQTKINFLYNEAEITTLPRKSINVTQSSVEKVLDELFLNSAYTYNIKGNNITIVVRNEEKKGSHEKPKFLFTGKVLNHERNPIVGAVILIKGTSTGDISTKDGSFKLFVGEGDEIEVSFAGMIPTIKPAFKSDKEVVFVLQPDEMVVSDVVVTGIYTRKSESFTGSYATFTAKDLKSIGNTNVLQSLKTLDPSFNIVENNEFGSDPNRLPDIEIRSKSSMLGARDAFAVDPNQPLFILDGFETTLEMINNLDMNRVESITILKDAASTAIYGSKAANGVVVVETVRPTAGKLRIGYSGSINTSIPDLSSYNMMNAREKLDFELLAGVYGAATADEEQLANEKYNHRLSEIVRGVDTYWLAEPLRIGINHKNSIYIEGGDGGFSFLVGGNYNGVTGVMKESNKEVIGGNIDLTYQIGKLRFINKFRADYRTSSDPIVTFDKYVSANPFHRKYDDEGNLKKYLEVIDNGPIKDGTYIENPMYNASLNSRTKSKQTSFTDNFNIEYRPITDIMIRGRFGLTKTLGDSEKFISPGDTQFRTAKTLKKGRYTGTHSNSFGYEGELTVSYATVLNNIHTINFVAGGNLSSRSNVDEGYYVEGFPEGDFTYPSFAAGYGEGSKPTYLNAENRSVSAYLNGGYSLLNRYLFDVSYRVNGASIFGSSKRYANTWAVGIAWNIHNEKFIKNLTDGISLFKVRASVGNPGNQNFDSFMTFTTYRYDFNSVNYFGMSTFMESLGNPNLKWQTTLDKNVGFDLTILNRRLTINADYYHKKTDPLLISINTPSSSGISTMITNMGNQISQGFTATVLGYVIYRPEERFTWSIRANVRTEKSILGGIGDKLEAFNKLGRKNQSLVRYYDGANPNDLWAIQSMGIDPATGREVFLRKDGVRTFDYDVEQERIVGNTRPNAEGIIGTSFKYKGFSADINFRYRFGADVFNNAVFSKVENIGDLTYNQDRRAYYDRWKKPGDNSKYKDIASTVKSPKSSRFVQNENSFALESLRVGYEFPFERVEGWGISSIKIDAFMSDVFRISSILSERGTAYPFARSFQLNLSINF